LLIGLLNDHATGNAALSLALVCGAGGILSASLLAKGCAPMRARPDDVTVTRNEGTCDVRMIRPPSRD
jgi:hypothetical protein